MGLRSLLKFDVIAKFLSFYSAGAIQKHPTPGHLLSQTHS